MSASSKPLSPRVKLALGLLLLIAAGVPLVYPLIQSKKSERVNTLRMPLLSIEETKAASTPEDGVLAVVCNRNSDATLTRLRVVFGEASPEERAGRAVEGRLSEPMPAASCREILFNGTHLRNDGHPEPATAWSALWDKDVPEQWEAFIPVKPKSP